MSDTPTPREPPPLLDRVLAAHERRALIAHLHEQAMATANNLSTRQKAIKASLAKDVRRRKAETWLFAEGAFLLALAAFLFGIPPCCPGRASGSAGRSGCFVGRPGFANSSFLLG